MQTRNDLFKGIQKPGTEKELAKEMEDPTDEIDVLTSLTRVYGKSKETKDRNTILAKLAEQEKKYYARQDLLAEIIRDYTLAPIWTGKIKELCTEYIIEKNQIIKRTNKTKQEQLEKETKEMAERKYRLITNELATMCILNRNRKDNPLVVRIIGRVTKEEETEEQQGTLGKLFGKLNFTKKKKEEED